MGAGTYPVTRGAVAYPPHPRVVTGTTTTWWRAGLEPERLPLGGDDALVQFAPAYLRRSIGQVLVPPVVHLTVEQTGATGIAVLSLVSFTVVDVAGSSAAQARAELLGSVAFGGGTTGSVDLLVDLSVRLVVRPDRAEVDLVADFGTATGIAPAWCDVPDVGRLDLLDQLLPQIQAVGPQRVTPTVSFTAPVAGAGSTPHGPALPTMTATLAATPTPAGVGLTIQVRVEPWAVPSGSSVPDFVGDADYGSMFGEVIIRRLLQHAWQQGALLRTFPAARRLTAARRGRPPEPAEVRGEITLETLEGTEIHFDTVAWRGYVAIRGVSTALATEVVFESDGERIPLSRFDAESVDVGPVRQPWSLLMRPVATTGVDRHATVAALQASAFWDLWNQLERPFAVQVRSPGPPDISLVPAADYFRRRADGTKVALFTGRIPPHSVTR